MTSLHTLTLAVALGILPFRDSQVAVAQSPLDSTLADLDRRLQDATVTGDTAYLEQHLADDFLFAHFGGAKDTKAMWIARAALLPHQFFARDVSDQLVETHGDVGLVLGQLDVRALPPPDASYPGPQCYSLRYVHLYAKRQGRWVWLGHQTLQMLRQHGPCG
jgi:ketosteroid isomerase-like protein